MATCCGAYLGKFDNSDFSVLSRPLQCNVRLHVVMCRLCAVSNRGLGGSMNLWSDFGKILRLSYDNLRNSVRFTVRYYSTELASDMEEEEEEEEES